MASYTYEEHGVCSSRCKWCRLKTGHDLPIPKDLSYDEISALATQFSHSIFAAWTQLNAIIKRFEPTIQKRWLKKSLKQKREILLKAWPGMSTTHRPDFANFRDSNRRRTPRTRTCSANAHLWPQINLEDLQHHHILLLFLNSRARNLPEMFIATDITSAHLGNGWDFEAEVEKADNDKKDMQFHNQRSPRSYGRMVDHDVAMWMHTIQPFFPGTGLVGLEIQDGIYSFLLSCTKLILHDIDPKQFLLAPHVPAPDLPEAALIGWPSLSAHMLESPYRVSQKMDIERIKTLVGSRRAAAEDHLWFLQEDPGYFSDTLKEWKEHSVSELRHTCAGCLNGSGESMITDAVTSFLCWDFIFRKLDSMPSMEAQFKRANWKMMRLHRKDETAWINLSQVITVMQLFAIKHLTGGVPSSPRLRHCYDWKALKDDQESVWHLRRDFSDAESRVEKLFYAIVNSKERKLHGTNKLVQEIQYMLETDSAAGQHVDEWIVGHFSDLAMLTDIMERIHGMQPWTAIWIAQGVATSERVAELLNDEIMHLYVDLQKALPLAICASKLLDAPLDGTFDYPIGKRQTRENVEQMRRAEEELDELWSRIESSVMKSSGISLRGIIAERLLEPRELHRTAEWMPALVPMLKTNPLSPLSTNVPRYEPFCSTSSISTPSQTKTKVKTKGVASSPAVPDQPSSPAPNAEDPTTLKIPVNKRIYKTLSALLPGPDAESHQRVEISWDELLQAMNAIGLQPEKLYGSVWMFRPKEDGLVVVKRSIQFHEPKEVRRGGKIPTNMVRTFGRRLRHAYGWESGMFVCA